MALYTGHRRTPWLVTASAWSEPYREYVEWGERDNAGNMVCRPSQKQRWTMGYCVTRVGWNCFVYALHSINDWGHDPTNGIIGWSRRILNFLWNVNFWKPLVRTKLIIFIFYVWVQYFARTSGWAIYAHSPAEIVGSKHTGGMDVCLLWVLCSESKC